MNSRVLALSLALALPAGVTVSPDDPLDGAREAFAAVSVLLSLDSLIDASTFVVVATASDKRSVWEDLPSGRRIVTYTKLTIERAVVGSPGTELWVRTLGGAVDGIGQSVSGEAQIGSGSRSLLFLRKTSTSVVVTGMAQGHFPLVAESSKATLLKLAPSPDAGTLLPRRGPSISAQERLVGATLDEALTAVKELRRGADEKK